jgi:hypothetical protein
MPVEKKGTLTAMAGEFYVMTTLYRKGYQPALTLGNAKSIDILVRNKNGKLLEISVKANCGGGKWPVGTEDVSLRHDLYFVLLHFTNFKDIHSSPKACIIPANSVRQLKEGFFESQAIYLYKGGRERIQQYENAWDLLEGAPDLASA